ncbi:MAG: ABC transporter ATP-binding protein [Bacteroides sp.]|nr:ABC transporter ATP-binding protein [Bacteroides sp.]
MKKTSHRLYSYIVRQKKLISLGILATLLMGLVELFTGSLLKFLINLIDKYTGSFDQGIAENINLPVKYQIDFPLFKEKVVLLDRTLSGAPEILRGMVWLCLLFLGLYFLLALFNYGRRVFMNAATQRILQNFKNDIYEKILRLPFSFFNRNKTGDVVSRITYDVTTLREIIDLFVEVARAGVYILIFVPVMFFMSWQLSIFTILFFPLSVIIINVVSRFIKKVSKKLTDNVGDYTAFLEEKINRFKLIKGARTEQKEAEAFAGLVESNYQYNLKLIKLKFSLNPTNDFLGMIALSAVYLIYSFRFSRGEFNLGDIVFYLYLVRTAYKPVKKVAQAWGQLQVALVSTRKIFRMLDEAEEVLDSPGLEKLFDGISTLGFEDVCFSYSNNGSEILKGITFQAKKGDIIAVGGKSGAGKSTLMNLIPGFYQAQKGDIKINGENYSHYSLNELRSRVAHVDSDTLFMNGSIRENIEYGNKTMDEVQKEEFSIFLGLKGPSELEQVIGKDGEDLSEGQKQKISFLRAIQSNPSVLILDEAFSSLDGEDINYIMKCCQKVNILFLVSRKKEVTQHANRKMTLLDGIIHE